MAARKKLVSTICIISLILAITAGVLLSVGNQSSNGAYVGDGVNLVNTAVNLNAGSMTGAVSNSKPADAPGDAVEITNQSTLESFLNGGSSYGYITADFDLNWSGTGTNKALGENRTINGNGHTVSLSDNDGTANQYKDSLGGSTASKGGTFTGGMDYGMFVAYNAGTITNIKFKFYNPNKTITISNDSGNIIPNYAGIVCGTNAPTGVISNCDLDANGRIVYNYQSGSLAIDDSFPEGNNAVRKAFSVAFGGFAGRNAGKISGVTANYAGFTKFNEIDNCFDISLNVKAANKSGIWGQRANAHTFAGGIAGTMYSNKSEISNVVLTGLLGIYMAPVSCQNTGISERAWRFAIAAAVVGANSAYSEAEGGIGEGAANQGKVDNIILGCNVQYSGKLGISAKSTNGNPDCQWPSEMSNNAVVFCGKATNVTLLNLNKRIASSQNVDYQTDHCNCGVGGNSGNHETGYANIINVDDNANVSLCMEEGVDEYGEKIYNQKITAAPKNSTNYMLGEFTFTKNMGKNEDADAEGNTSGMQSSNGVDTSNPYGVPKNDTIYLYTMEDVRQSSYDVTIAPYQAGSAKYWEADITAYQIATISDADTTIAPATDTNVEWAKEYVYNGFDFLTRQLKYTPKDSSKPSGIVDPAGFNAISTGEDERAVTSGRLPGEYSFTLQEKEAGLSYINKSQRVVVFAAETVNLAPFTFKVTKANMQIQGLTVEEINSKWFNEVTDFNFEVVAPKVQANAANGYVYNVNGSDYSRTGLALTNDTSTSKAGRTYTVYLTSGGVQVTNPITYTVRIDLENPTLKLPHYEHSDGRYYTHNRVSINAQDEHSGVASIIMYNRDNAGNLIGDPVDVIAECEDNSGENDLSYIDEETGYYVWYFSYSGRIIIEVTDVAGLKTQRELDINIDNVKPEITVNAYFYEELPGDDGVTTKKTTYTNGKPVNSAIYFEATATFGESGGQIQYSYDNVNWNTYDAEEKLVVKVSGDIYFRALSNAFDHYDTYPYKKMYQVDTYWSQNLTTNAQGKEVTTPFEVVVDVEHGDITNDDIFVTNTTKEFDGTTYFDVANIQATADFKAGINGDIIFTAEYVDVNAGDVAIHITARCTDNNKVLDNKIDDVLGVITKKEISVKVDNQEKYFGYALPELTYKQTGMIAGFEEEIELYVDKGDFAEYTYELLPQSKRDDTNNGYVITVAEGMTFINYTLPAANITTGILQIDLAPIDRLVYKKAEFAGLDTNNIAKRNLEIGFMRVTGDYQKLIVTFERRYYDDSNGTLITRWEKPITDMKNAKAGFYRVTISMPERTTIGNRVMADMYELDPSIKTFMIKVIDADKFVVDAGFETQDAGTEQAAPVINNGSAQPSDYEGKTTSTDSTGTEIEPTAKKTRDYIAIVSIFCAVIMVVAFAIGIGRAVMKRAKR